MAEVDSPPRALPHDIQTEMGVLGSMMLSPVAIHLARERLRPDSFYNLSHQVIFAAILDVSDQCNTVDLLLLRDELKKREKLDQVGGQRYLQELMEAVPTSANAEYYIEIVRNLAVRRHLIEASTKVLNESREDGRDVDELLDDAEHSILDVRNMKRSGQVRDMRELLTEVMRHVDLVHQHPGMLTGLATGFHDLNDLTGGLQPGELIVVAARPSVGKTTLALNMLRQVCLADHKPAALFSLEMRAEQIVKNFLCMEATLDTSDFRRGTLKDSDWEEIEKSIDKMTGLPLFIDDTPALRMSELRARARRLRYQEQIEFLVVDYMQLLRPSRSRDNRATEVAEISAGLKALARELEVPLLAVAQLNRSVDTESRRPRMSDLRESGAIEQDADVIMLLHRDDYGREAGSAEEEETVGAPRDAANMPGSYADVIIAKQRNGPTGVCKLVFWKRYLRFQPRSAVSP